MFQHLKGKLSASDKAQLAGHNGKPVMLDSTDIPLRVFNGHTSDGLKISDCYMGIQHRAGLLRVDNLIIESFVNDGVGAWHGETAIKLLKIKHDLDFKYSKYNHSDCWHWQTKSIHSNVTIERAELELNGFGSQDKGKFIASETGVNDHFNLFSMGVIVKDKGRFKNRIPLVNLNNCRNSTFGSPLSPIGAKEVGGKDVAFRVMGRKRGSPRSINNIIHVFDDMRLEFDNSAKSSFFVRVYKRSWKKQERLDNWEIAKADLLWSQPTR